MQSDYRAERIVPMGPINRKFSRYKGGRARERVNTMCAVDICACFACRSCAAEKHFRERETRVCAAE